MKPHGIAKGFDVLEHAKVSGFEISERLMLGPLMLEGPEEAFGDGVVVAIPGAAHRAFDPRGSQGLLVRVARVLAASIAVVQQFSADRSPGLNGLPQGLGHRRVGVVENVNDCVF